MTPPEDLLDAEASIYEQGPIHVTTQRLVVRDQAYAMGAIIAVKMKRSFPGLTLVLLFLAGGLLVMTFGISTIREGGPLFGPVTAGFGAFGVVIAALLAANIRPTYIVELTLLSGEVSAWSSQDKRHTSKIVAAINKALATSR